MSSSGTMNYRIKCLAGATGVAPVLKLFKTYKKGCASIRFQVLIGTSVRMGMHLANSFC